MTAEASASIDPPRIAIVDDDAVARHVMGAWLTKAGYRPAMYASGGSFLAESVASFAAVCLDLGLEDMSGLDVLAELRARDPELPVIVVTAHRATEVTVEAMRAGAYDFLVKPVDPDRLAQALHRAIERRELSARVHSLRRALEDRHGLATIVGDSRPVKELRRTIERVLDSDVAVCVLGESGTGKELVARAIHTAGARARGPFVALNCASIPQALQESELFGHERGSFTGASGLYRGRFEQAHGGTLFLDELGEMSAATQASLLRTLQERTIRRVGGQVEIPIDVRIVAATHRDLEAEVAARRFREDLFFRLVVYPIQVPPLRDRRDDIPLLIGHFLHKLHADVGREAPLVSAEALEALMAHRWPGNIRELSNVLHRAMLCCDGGEITLAHLPASIAQGAPTRPQIAAPRAYVDAPGGGVTPMRELERQAILRALEEADGNVGRAAKLLGIGRATLYRRLAGGGIVSGSA